jgi:2-oxoglutarate ferredoxin oxidoreductase subunit alpha
MIVNRLTWMIGGAQGSGINSVAETFARACIRGGLHVFANIEYHSNIKGEHSYYRVRVGDTQVRSHVDWVDLLVALDKETLFGDTHKEHATHPGHIHEVIPGGAVIYDAALNVKPEEFNRPDVKLFPVPYLGLLTEVLKSFGKEKELSAYQVMVNTVSFGASVGLVDYDFEAVASAIKEGFTGRKAHLADMNIAAARAGYDFMQQKSNGQFEFRLSNLQTSTRRMMIRGVQAVGMAKFKAGCGLQTYYPITPATDESEYLESHQKKYDITVVQAEDEIAALTMAIGAAHGGVRASTSTSGPGFSLMAEGLGWAGITEAPGPVVILYQRTGPSTGLPTRTEQGDLRFVLHASHGEFPRLVVAPGDHQEIFYETFHAFNYAEMFQVPVIVVVDKFLASTYTDHLPFETDSLKVDRGHILTEEEIARVDQYKRYKFTGAAVSPRTIPGTKGGLFWTTGDEHDEFGHITENASLRTQMMQKRMNKILLADGTIPEERKYTLHGPEHAELTIVGWGSIKGAILDAMNDLADDGLSCNFLQLRYFSPFPSKAVEEILSSSKVRIGLEANYSGQAIGIVREKTGIEMDHRILKYNGRPFSQNEIYEGIKEAVSGGKKEVVMNHA